MLGSPILDLAIGMAFIYLLLSLIASVVQEAIASVTQARAANLERALHSLFSGDYVKYAAKDGEEGVTFMVALYKHGLIRGLYRDPDHDNKKPTKPSRHLFGRLLRSILGLTTPNALNLADNFLLPAYIPARAFSLALTDLLNDQSHGGTTLENIKAYLLQLKTDSQAVIAKAKGETSAQDACVHENKAVEALSALLEDAGTDAEKFQTNLEHWYNDSMDRASGWYKRHVQQILLIIGLCIAIVFNVDSVRVARTLWFDHDARQGLATAASEYIKSHSAPQPTTANIDPGKLEEQLNSTVKSFDDVSQATMLPVGWRHKFPNDYWNAFWHNAGGPGKYALYRQLLLALLGWCITAGALSLGAPFWFDTLNKFMVVRSTVKPSEKSPTEKSKD